MGCIFCTDDQIKKRIIVKNNLVFAFPTNIPVSTGHTLICPVRHVTNAHDLSKDELNALFEMASRLSESLKETFGAEGFNYAWNEGESAGQNVQHFHLHIIPRKKDDGKEKTYISEKPKTSTEAELIEVANIIRNYYDL